MPDYCKTDADKELWAWCVQDKARRQESANRRCEAKAKAMGFSSQEEYSKHYLEQCREAETSYENRINEQCALLDKTREEIEAEDPQRYIPDDDWLVQCDCDGECLFAVEINWV